MNIDIESIVREEVRNLIREHLNINTGSVKITVKPKRTVNKRTNEPDSGWEFASVKGSGKRRTTEEMALHELEKEKGRRLTPEEKGEAKAKVQMDETTENTVKEATIKKARIDEIAAEGMAAASKELAEERDDNITRVQEGMDKHDIENEIPKAESINTPNSLFTS